MVLFYWLDLFFIGHNFISKLCHSPLPPGSFQPPCRGPRPPRRTQSRSQSRRWIRSRRTRQGTPIPQFFQAASDQPKTLYVDTLFLRWVFPPVWRCRQSPPSSAGKKPCSCLPFRCFLSLSLSFTQPWFTWYKEILEHWGVVCLIVKVLDVSETFQSQIKASMLFSIYALRRFGSGAKVRWQTRLDSNCKLWNLPKRQFDVKAYQWRCISEGVSVKVYQWRCIISPSRRQRACGGQT